MTPFSTVRVAVMTPPKPLPLPVRVSLWAAELLAEGWVLSSVAGVLQAAVLSSSAAAAQAEIHFLFIIECPFHSSSTIVLICGNHSTPIWFLQGLFSLEIF